MGGLKRRRPSSSSGGTERMRCDALTVSYGDKPAVRAVNLPVRQGEVLALIGPSGCGKTTLLRVIGGFEEPDEGDVLLSGTSVVVVPPNNAAWLTREAGSVSFASPSGTGIGQLQCTCGSMPPGMTI